MRLRTQSVPSKTSTVFMGRLLSSGTAEIGNALPFFDCRHFERDVSVSYTFAKTQQALPKGGVHWQGSGPTPKMDSCSRSNWTDSLAVSSRFGGPGQKIPPPPWTS
jgi:hypothetical protein